MDRFEVEDNIVTQIPSMSGEGLEKIYNLIFNPKVHYNIETGVFEEEE